MLDIAVPTAVRRTVDFSEAIRLGETQVEDIEGKLASSPEEALALAHAGTIAVLVDP